MVNSTNGVTEVFSNMALAECREKTFTEWPFKKGKCVAKEMAKAGFYVTNKEENVVTCYFCYKELEGWERDDDPFQEHKKHASFCQFVSMFDKAPENITFTQLLHLERARGKRLWELEINRICEKSQQAADVILKSYNTRRRYPRRK